MLLNFNKIINEDKINNQLISLFLLALILRIIYFLLALSNQDINSLLLSISDSEVYWTIAQHFIDSHPQGEYWLFQVGPGYGLLLASVYKFFGESLYALYIFNIFIGSLAPIVVYFLADELLQNKKVAFIAGFISAVSFTSISLSCNILSDQLFFTTFTFAILLFVKGLNKGEIKWFVWAGVIAGIAVYIRAVGMFWIVMFPMIALLIPLPNNFKSKAELLKKVCITSGIIFLMVFTWSAKNYVEHNVFTFGGNGIKAARIRLASMAIAKNTDWLTYEQVNHNFITDDSIYFNGRQPTIKEEYNRDKEQFLLVVNEHPYWIVKTFVRNIGSNLLAGNYFPTLNMPQYNNFWNVIITLNEKFLAAFALLIALFGFGLLVYNKQRTAWVLLATISCYFAIINGFTMGQGSRLQYPIEIAWSILVTYFLFESYKFIKNKYRKSETNL